MSQIAASDSDLRSAKTVGDALQLWLEKQGDGPFHYRDDIWKALVEITPEEFSVTEERKTPWFTIHRTLSEDSRFEKVKPGYFRLAQSSGRSRPAQDEDTRYATMHDSVRERVNEYLETTTSWYGHIGNEELLAEQRSKFLERFGPQRIREMSSAELLRNLPHNASNDEPMDYWLEFKNDDDFQYAKFGSISGGSAAKFGLWQEKETGQWRAKLVDSKKIEYISEAKAEELVEVRRREILAAVRAIEDFRGVEPADIDPGTFQAAVEEAAPRWHRSAWLHKYLHMALPDMVTWNGTENWSNAALCRLGIVPPELGMYANDVLIIRFWTSLPALEGVPVEVCYRIGRGQGPRKHWCLGLAREQSDLRQQMIAGGYLAIGPAEIGDLREVFALSKKAEIQMAVETVFEDAGASASSDDARNLIELAYRLEEGRHVTLLDGTATAVAVGEVAGEYNFARGEALPHRIPVQWLHDQPFETRSPISSTGRLIRVRHKDGIVADIEASLIVNGFGFWPEFSDSSFAKPLGKSIGLKAEAESEYELPELSGLPARIASMLERKHQVILYGPPGTGKTYHAERLAREIVARHNFRRPYAALTKTQRRRVDGGIDEAPYVESCTFHPMYSYEDFIEGYRPDGEGFSLKSGIFKRVADVASDNPDEKYVLIIDEINRGNIPRIFGELITLIESTRRGVSRARLPLSGESFCVPPNLYIIGTMNTADRSILLLDTALRRRFAFLELMPDPGLLKKGNIGDVSLSAWLRALNRRIVDQLGRDGRNLQVGHSYLMTGRGKPIPKLDRIAAAFRDEIWPLLQEYCYEDPHKLVNILGGLYDRDRANLRYELFEPGNEDALTAALIAILTPEDKKEDAALEEETVEVTELADDEEELS